MAYLYMRRRSVGRKNKNKNKILRDIFYYYYYNFTPTLCYQRKKVTEIAMYKTGHE